MDKKRILVVDDDQDELLFLTTALREVGHEVLVAEDSPTAQKLLASEIPDLVITDIMMPGESGYSLLSSIKDNPLFSETPVIVTTALDEELEVLNMGATAYLGKPFDAEDLLEEVDRALAPKKTDLTTEIDKVEGMLEKKNYMEAELVLQGILERSEGVGDGLHKVLYYLGEVKRIAGNPDDAVIFYKKALQMKPDFWRAFTRLGILFLLKKDDRRAVSYFKQSLALNPDQKEIAAKLSHLQQK